LSISKRKFGMDGNGTVTEIYKLTNSRGMSAEITNYGAILVSLSIPDRKGLINDVVLGFDDIESYIADVEYLGATIGRYANRIEDGVFELNGIRYELTRNSEGNCIHGGTTGFSKVVWNAEIKKIDSHECLQLSYLSKDLEENFPGELDVRVMYSLTEDNALMIDYFAVSDKDTIVNLTNHSYFNLSGHASGDVLKHEIMINADSFTATDSTCLATGEIRSVKGTPMDFRKRTVIGSVINSDYEQIASVKGFDHNFILNGSGKINIKAAEVYDPESGCLMQVYTTTPGVQFYIPDFKNSPLTGKNGAIYGGRDALCLETQYFPNAMKHRHFPSPVLRADQEYKQKTIYKFSIGN
jgi:aldose 1-epimerase